MFSVAKDTDFYLVESQQTVQLIRKRIVVCHSLKSFYKNVNVCGMLYENNKQKISKKFRKIKKKIEKCDAICITFP